MRSRTEKSQRLSRTKESQVSCSTEKSQPLTRTDESQASSSIEKSQTLTRTDESQASSRKERSESNINRSQSVRSQIQNFQLTNLSAEFGADLEEELSLSEIFEKADSKDFPKKSFLIDGKLKSYTWILNFFTSIRIITESASKKNIEFTCKFCKMRNLSGFPDFTNLYKHLRIHNAYRKYGKLYQNRKGLTKPLVSHKQMIFIQYICSSNVALSEVQNPFLNELLRPLFTVPSFKTARSVMLPEVYHHLCKLIEKRLNSAKTVSLMADLWTSANMSDYMGIAAALTYDLSKKELIVIGFDRMVGNHTAENIKLAIEKLINNYDFDKSKISCEKLNFVLRFF